jgi:hypothetical protein
MLDVPHKDKPADTEKEGSNNLHRDAEFGLEGSVINSSKLFGRYIAQPATPNAAKDASDKSFAQISYGCFISDY